MPGDGADVVAKIQAGDWEPAYRLLKARVRFPFALVRAQDREDQLHDLLLTVVSAVQRGQLRDPARLLAFARAIARRRVADYVEHAVKDRERRVSEQEQEWWDIVDFRHNPEQVLLRRERRRLMRAALAALSRSDVELLTRFYLQEQSKEQICSDLTCTETQFANRKSRAAAKLEKLVHLQLKRGAYSRLQSAARAA
jgi:RNA polymerase sigma factor (sigma-70 family)